MNRLKISSLIFFMLLARFTAMAQISTTGQTKPEVFRYYTDSIYSKSLREYRKMNIYLPPGFKPGDNCPVIYATDGFPIDGKGRNRYAAIVDSLITANAIPPVILVEAYSNQKQANSIMMGGEKAWFTYRNYEYVERSAVNAPDTIYNKLFARHFAYFTGELIADVEQKLGLKGDGSKRIFYGCSNGAGFGINMMHKRPELFNTYICFSSVGSGIDGLVWEKRKKYPMIYLEHGDEEPVMFRYETGKAEAVFKKHKIKHSKKVYHGDHDNARWEEEFALLLPQVLQK